MKKVAILVVAVVLASWSVMADTYVVNTDASFGFGTSSDPASSGGNLVQQLEGGYLSLGLESGAVLNQVSTDLWYGSGATNMIVEECAGYATTNTFGYYTSGPNKTQLFAGANSAGDIASFTLNPAQNFGFYLGVDPDGAGGNPPVYWYSQSSLNGGDGNHVAVFQDSKNPNVFILGWEDLRLANGDKDYQDMVVKVTLTSVPEPSSISLMLLGMTGLFGLGFARRKK